MARTRTFFTQHRWLTFWLVMVAVLGKLLIPAGYMPVVSNGGMMITLCTGNGPKTVIVSADGSLHKTEQQQEKHDSPCAFSGLTTHLLDAAGPIFLILALAFILSVLFSQKQHLFVQARAFLSPPASRSSCPFLIICIH